MTVTYTGSIVVTATNALLNALNLGTANFSGNKTYTQKFTNGVAANQANMVWADTRTLAASANESLDLYGTLKDANGNTVNFTGIKGMIIAAASTNTNDIIVGGASANAFSSFLGTSADTIIIQPGGFLSLVNPTAGGYGVTASTADLLKIANSAGTTSVTYDIILIGKE